MATISEYGTWKSPITAELATAENVSITPELHVDHDGSVFFQELRPAEKGRYVVCSKKAGDKNITEWTPGGFNARTLVHEYGGASFIVADSKVFFSNFVDQRLYCQDSATSQPKPVTPAGVKNRFADGFFSPKLKKLYYVREDHEVIIARQATEAEHSIVSISLDGFQQKVVVSGGADFYSSPRVSPNGEQIAWVQWSHPNMPWDATELVIAQLSPSGDEILKDSIKKVELGPGVNYIQPSWTSKGELLFIADPRGWWNLYVRRIDGTVDCLIERKDEIGFPQWVFGIRAYELDSNGNLATTYDRKLGLYNMKTAEYKQVETGYSVHTSVAWGSDGCLYVVAGSPTSFNSVIKVQIKGKTNVELVRTSTEVVVNAGYLSAPESVTYPTTEGDVSHAYLYLPKNKDFRGPATSLPPLLVKVHGGPTASVSSVLRMEIQYFTSRGFAILDVNYRGSTGYGTEYRNKLRGNWGVYDIDDCCQGAMYLVDKKLVDPARLCIDGGSAGGYTTLASLAFRDIFKAGASHYGVSDLGALARDTHKFESRYLDLLIGPYPAADQVYRNRSPIFNIETFSCPIIFFQGEEDKIVLPDQAERMYEALKNKGLPTAYVLFPNEQHGFRDGVNRQKALTGEFYFFSRVFNFTPADSTEKIRIENLD